MGHQKKGDIPGSKNMASFWVSIRENFGVGELLGAVQVLLGHQGPLPSDVFELRHLTDGGSDDCGVWMMEMVYL